MIVCVCANVNQQLIVRAIKGGCLTKQDLIEELNVCSNCETCSDIIDDMLTSYTERQTIV